MAIHMPYANKTSADPSNVSKWRAVLSNVMTRARAGNDGGAMKERVAVAQGNMRIQEGCIVGSNAERRHT